MPLLGGHLLGLYLKVAETNVHNNIEEIFTFFTESNYNWKLRLGRIPLLTHHSLFLRARTWAQDFVKFSNLIFFWKDVQQTRKQARILVFNIMENGPITSIRSCACQTSCLESVEVFSTCSIFFEGTPIKVLPSTRPDPWNKPSLFKGNSFLFFTLILNNGASPLHSLMVPILVVFYVQKNLGGGVGFIFFFQITPSKNSIFLPIFLTPPETISSTRQENTFGGVLGSIQYGKWWFYGLVNIHFFCWCWFVKTLNRLKFIRFYLSTNNNN